MSKSKLLRLSSLLLCVLFAFTIFGSNVSAAGEDFDPDLTNWTSSNELYNDVCVRFVSDPEVYDVCFRPIPLESGAGYRMGYFFDTTNLVAGNSYTLSFCLLTPAEVDFLSDGTVSPSTYDYYKPFTEFDGVLAIGLGTHSKGDFVFNGDYGVAITKDNYESFFGYTTKITFTMPSSTNSAIGIYYTDYSEKITYNNVHFYMCNFSLVCNSTKVYDDINSSIDNLNGTLSSGFDGLGSILSDGFSGLADLITNGFSNLLSGIGNFFENLENGILNAFIDLGKTLLDGILSLFVPSEDDINDFMDKMELLLKDHLGIVYEVGDFFTDFLGEIFNLLSDTENGELHFVFPGIDFNLNGQQIHLWNDTEVDMSFLQTNSVFKGFYAIYKVIVIVILSFALFKYAYDTWEGVLSH